MSAQSEDDAGEFADSRPDEDIGGNLWDPHNLIKRLPHEVGLSPLGCGNCGAEEIYDHPCPECDYSPGRDDAQSTLEGWQ